MQVSQEKLLQYIHFNRQYNSLLIEHNTKLIEQLRTEMETVKATEPSTQLEVESVQPESGESKQIYYHFTFSTSGPPENTLLCKTLKDC